ncbi:MAG TPA: hydrogen peroxide-dependent heme synthase [Bdellovibrionota bacterium]|nr:hydrogen peroxide-dependent heme synthase [Bdellovibrionota bacterium]
MSQLQKLVVPETLEGWAVLHEFFRVRWDSWRRRSASEQEETLSEASEFLKNIGKPKAGESVSFSLLGHKGDLLLLHFRKTFEELNDVELQFRQLRLFNDLEETTSYVSVVELGLYEMSVKLHGELSAEGLKPDSDEWKSRWRTSMEVQAERMKGRLFTAIPSQKYVCFYPMNKRRGEHYNWYELPIEPRQEMMRDHGMIGRKYAGEVTQVISGSTGLDDWEWGVDLFAENPIVFKKLIYEMRFDEASSKYAEFGPFYIGIRFQPERLKALFSGRTPA